ncbi:MAG: phage head-tail connector protein [Chitinophagaceae bacterium]|jgi:uncharacterized phiE125 gp8 family phage protein|nr:phage head-tail connector protein [Chitinophagaceae bacterium]
MGNYSYTIDSQVTEVSYAEPVTLAEAKLKIRVSHAIEDAMIARMISSARKIIEDAAGISIITKVVKVWFSNKGGAYQLPYGPITSDITLYDDYTGTILTDKRIIGGNYPRITFPQIENMRAEYTVGYTHVPAALKDAILDQLNYMYENRGAENEGTGICEQAWRACQQFTRQSPIL